MFGVGGCFYEEFCFGVFFFCGELVIGEFLYGSDCFDVCLVCLFCCVDDLLEGCFKCYLIVEVVVRVGC